MKHSIKTKLEYNITVENDIDKVTIQDTVEDSTSTMVGDGEKTLSIGDNRFDVVVTSSNNIEEHIQLKYLEKQIQMHIYHH